MKIASFSKPFKEYSMHQTMRYIKELGFDGIEIACREPHLSPETSNERVQEIKELADGYGLEIPALAGYLGHFTQGSDEHCEKAYEDFGRLVEHAKILGADMVRIFQGGPNSFKAVDYHYEKAAYWLNRCAEVAQNSDKKIVLEIHNNSIIENADDCLRLLDLIDYENVGFIHDAGNMYVSDYDFGPDSIRKLEKHLFHVHAKDVKRVKELRTPNTVEIITRHGEEYIQLTLLGEGDADHQPVFDTLKGVGYSGWVTLECDAPYPPKERMAHDLKQVRNMLHR